MITAAPAEIERMKAEYQPFFTGKTPPGALFSAKKNGLTVTAYRSGKVMFQGAQGEVEAAKWSTANPAKKKNVRSGSNTSS
ncbi:ribonuclease HIII [Listeria floridensis FSL S10-1187]|uniref:Ribonuclease HIII n=1 Tax=Listeria floridensis FSL S10-1187 TaxID=1265817 RepID=A0ABP3AWL7_9LIST|nr:ribonuclease HIII [Listeria floridensis FSL S10-1187]